MAAAAELLARFLNVLASIPGTESALHMSLGLNTARAQLAIKAQAREQGSFSGEMTGARGWFARLMPLALMHRHSRRIRAHLRTPRR